ncbi:hypothetical protein [Pseudomonas sp. OIL-1]|uniref:hypothetical protein n=1 Tax=Pseudomonas sp. OIL-1 TaxID=2706126 RepID=UPI0013A77C0C|nr:hypothetical protein [Pseudomonas sp. OIL-1]QIB51749.1 hypothetical protein G3M63_12240 [Pseudomonas sp. OIL-1]
MIDKKAPEDEKPSAPEPSQDEPDITMNDAGEGGPGEDPDYDEAGEGDDGIDDRH